MLWLAGLMGMMVLGSVAVIGTQEAGTSAEDDPPEPAEDAEEGGPRGLFVTGSDGRIRSRAAPRPIFWPGSVATI